MLLYNMQMDYKHGMHMVHLDQFVYQKVRQFQEDNKL